MYGTHIEAILQEAKMKEKQRPDVEDVFIGKKTISEMED
jgi:hypothetical protein